MSIGPTGGIPANAAGLPLAQAKGATDHDLQDLALRQRATYYSEKADIAAGVGETDGENHEIADRDADGRLLGEPMPNSASPDKKNPPKSKDPTGECGNLLDLTG
jgi:hypothetical protein